MGWLRQLFTRRYRYDELSESIQEHVEEKISHLIDRGMMQEEAERTARREFGNVTLIEERSREVWQWPKIESIWADVKFASRQLRRSPGFTLVALLTLSLGIGANTAIFSVVNGVLLHPLPFGDPARLMMLDEKWLPRFSHFEATPKDFLAWREQSQAFDQLGAFASIAFNLSGSGRSERVTGARVTANLPELLGVKPLLGRSFTTAEDTQGNDHVVLLGYSLWKERFGGDANAIGSVIRLNDLDFTVIGVMPAGFCFPHDAEIWKPMGFATEDFDGGHFLWGIGRLKANMTRDQAQAEMDSIMPRLRSPQIWSVNVFPLLDYYTGEVRTPLYVLMGAAGLVLLIACVNVASLLLARGSTREAEISLRASLGANRRRIIQQLLTEGFMLAAIGGLLGVSLAYSGITVLKKFPLTNIPRFEEVTLDPTVLLFTTLVSVLTGLVFASLPALRLSRANLLDPLKAGNRASTGGKRAQVRSILVISEVAVALILLTGSCLVLKSFWRLLQVNTGFNPDNVVTAKIDLPALKYKEPYRQEQFAQALVERLASAPGIIHAAVSSGLPFSDAPDAGIRIDGRAIGATDAGTTANYYRVTSQYFRTMEIPLVRGRLFTEQDTAISQPVVIINETMARRFFPTESPIGKRIDISGPTYLREIVGVVGDVKQAGMKIAIAPQVYEPFVQKPSDSLSVIVRSSSDAASLTAMIRQQVYALDKDQPISNVMTMKENVAASMTGDRFSTILLGIFALLALVLAAVGIYGVIAYSVLQRTQEFSIRMAVGANRSDIMGIVFRHGLVLTLTGMLIGIGGALLLTRMLTRLLYQISPLDMASFISSVVLLGLISIAAFVIPSYRAGRLDPVRALRGE
ncbi:MAG TPA: ABC transporter permease [Terracidiphilus sp.]|nr:ABC transporter permease [Terracidiphilus sp.]